MTATAIDVPIVGSLVDRIVSGTKHLVDHLPEPLRTLCSTVLQLVFEAAALFAVALTLGGALFYCYPALAAMFPHWLGGSPLYWGYVLAVLGGLALYTTVQAIRGGNTSADVLSSKESRTSALAYLRMPGLIVMLGWLITSYLL